VDVRGLQTGATSTLVIDGDALGKSPKLLLPFAATQKLKPGNTDRRATFEVAPTGKVVPGYYYLRVVTEGGVSLPTPIAVDGLPQRPLVADKVETLPVALSGALTGSTTLSTKIEGKAGQKVTVEVEAARLGSKLRPIVHLYDAKRKQIAWAWTSPAVGGDARLQATLPANGTYTITVHDAEYQGGSPGFFRLKIGQWAYADQVFPPAVGKGHKFVELLAPSGPVKVDLPAARPDAFLALDWPKGEWSGPRPFVAVSEHEEVLAKGDGKVQDVPKGPVGVSGRLIKAYAEDQFRVPVEPGSKVRLEVFADRLGSPLHASLVVRNDKGAQLARADEGPTALDPSLVYAVPAGVKSIIVAVVDAQGRGGPMATYRLTVKPDGAETGDFTLRTASRRVQLPVGGRSVVPVLLERNGYKGKVELKALGLPAGVTLAGTTIPEGAEGALVTVNRGAAAFEPIIARWEGTDGKKARPVRAGEGELEETQPWLATELPIAATDAKAADFLVDWGALPADLGIVPTRKLNLPIKLTRADDKAFVRLTLMTSQIVPRVNGNPDLNRAIRAERPVELAPKVKDGQLDALVPADLAATSYEIAIRADMLAPDRRRVLATAYTPVKRLAVRWPLVVSVAPRVEVKPDAKKPTMVEIRGKVERREGLTGDVALTITGLPPGLAAAPVTVKAPAVDFAFKINLPANFAAGEFKNVKVAGTAAPDAKQPGVRVRREAELTLVVLAASK
jgi:hypothetical protein